MVWKKRLERIGRGIGTGAGKMGRGVGAGIAKSKAEAQRRRSPEYLRKQLEVATLRRKIATERMRIPRTDIFGQPVGQRKYVPGYGYVAVKPKIKKRKKLKKKKAIRQRRIVIYQ